MIAASTSTEVGDRRTHSHVHAYVTKIVYYYYYGAKLTSAVAVVVVRLAATVVLAPMEFELITELWSARIVQVRFRERIRLKLGTFALEELVLELDPGVSSSLPVQSERVEETLEGVHAQQDPCSRDGQEIIADDDAQSAACAAARCPQR